MHTVGTLLGAISNEVAWYQAINAQLLLANKHEAIFYAHLFEDVALRKSVVSITGWTFQSFAKTGLIVWLALCSVISDSWGLFTMVVRVVPLSIVQYFTQNRVVCNSHSDLEEVRNVVTSLFSFCITVSTTSRHLSLRP